MNCREAQRLLDTFFDGELDGRLMRDAALHITRCQSCERELQEKEGVKTLLADTIEDTIQSADLSAIWAGVEAGIQSGGQNEQFAGNGQAAANMTAKTAARTVDSEVAADAGERTIPTRHAFGRRAGGRHGGGRGARRRVGRASVAGMGAVAVGLAAFLVFNVGPEQEDPQLLAEPAVGRSDAAATKLAAETAPRPAAVKRVLASTTPKTNSSSIEQVALVQGQPKLPGPVGVDEPLSSEWPQQQVQAGPLEFSTNHAMSLWRPPTSR